MPLSVPDNAIASRPLVSILSPSFNQAAYIEQMLASVAAQDYPNVEHILVDGGSTDGTLNIISRCGAAGFKWSVELGTSQSEALNFAFEQSNGEIIGWLNTDDAYVYASVVSEVVELFDRHPMISAICGDGLCVDSEGSVRRYLPSDPAQLAYITSRSPIVQPAAFIRRKSLGGHFLRNDLDVAMDHELWLRLGTTGKLLHVQRPFAIDRNYASRKSRTRRLDGERERQQLSREYSLPLDDRRRIVLGAGNWYARLRTIPATWRIATTEDDLLDGLHVNGHLLLLIRQLLVPQRWIDSLS